MLNWLLVALVFPSVSGAQQPAPAVVLPTVAPPAAQSPFKSQATPVSPTIEYPDAGVTVRLVPGDGQFVIEGSGLHALRRASLTFRSAGKTYRPGAGLRLQDNHIVEGANTVGRFIELSALWLVQNPTSTHIRSTVRLYEGLNGVVFEQSYPDGAKSTGALRFNDVGCAFPVFYPTTDNPAALTDKPAAEETKPAALTDKPVAAADKPAALTDKFTGLRWLSYTYQDWPIPIRGTGWPNWVNGLGWPAPGLDDGIRAPLVLFNNAGNCEVLSPLDHGLQQITALAPVDTTVDDSAPPAIMVGGEGRLQELPAGASFHSVLLFGKAGVVATVMDWGRFLQKYNGKAAWKTPDDPTAHWLGYWTDNGSAYYSHGAGNANYQAVLAAVRAYHAENHIPVRYYQLDSWWYPKGVDGGTLTWDPNPVTIPNGAAGISRIVGMPVALHNRYW
ncbi:MAG: hypothetical protein M3Y56_04685, partial [Armatimonadota bacterium]|nr:hypothetical protein [Armatimonadota bacterium]